MKIFKLLKKGRKLFFTLALFLLVFAAASVVKIQAGTEHSASGWMWGGGTGVFGDGTNTNVGWISVNSVNQGGAVNYGLNIPDGNGDLTGYVWSENIGWISFNAADASGCPDSNCKASRVTGNNLKGWARILSIKDALAAGNSGGWQGWISLSGPQYSVKIDGNSLSGYAWSDELGWIDFSRVKIKSCPALSCATKEICAGQTFSSCDASFCSQPTGTPGISCTPNGTNWTCTDDCGNTKSCSAVVQPRVDGACGTANGGSFCQGRTPTDAELCSAGTSDPSASSIDINAYQVSWTCQGTCGGGTVSCSARGTKACGWIETNP